MKSYLSKLKTLFLDKNLFLWLILAVSAFLRLYRIQDYMTFLGDEGRDVLIVYNILHGHPTLLGPTASVGGFFLGPIYYYFMAPFLWLFNYDPVGPAVMVALFGIATVYLLYKFASEIFNSRVGLISALLYSISPVVISYSRSSWNPNIFPFFSLISLYTLYKAIKKKNFRLFLLCGVLLGISMQLHYLALFLVAIIISYVLLTRILLASLVQGVSLLRTMGKILRDYLFIVLGFVVGWSPFLAFEIRHGFPNIKSIIKFIFTSGDAGLGNNFLGNISNVFFRLFARLVTYYPPPEQVAISTNPNIAVWYYLSLLLAIVSFTILIYQFIKVSPLSKKNFKENFPDFLKISLLSIWFVLGVGLFGFYKKPIYDYYFGFMFPLPFILVGNSLDFLMRKNNLLKILSVFVLLSLVLFNLSGVPFRYEPNRQLNQVKKISEFVLDKADKKPFNFALITGGNSDHAYRYFFTLWGRPPVPIENPQKDPKRKSVTDQLLVICEQNPCHPLGNSLWEVAGFGRAEIKGEWDVIVVKIYKLIHYKGK